MDKINQIKELTKKLLYHCHLYYDLDAPIISDAEYDKYFDELKRLEDETGFYLADSPTRHVQGEVLPFLEKVHHSVPMLSADKSTNIEDVKKFVGNKEVVTSYKLDGATVVLKYNNGTLQQALTRGSGVEGEQITHTARMIKNLPLIIPYQKYLEIRGEALIPWDKYNEMNVDGSLGHPRNVASGGLRQLNANEAAKRNIYFYAFTLVNWKDVGVKTKIESLQLMEELGFDVVPYNSVMPVEASIAILNREQFGLPTDGWCFEYNDLAYGESLGSTSHHDRRLFALKPQIEEYITHFRGIEYNICRSGVVSLTALFDPVEIGNTKVRKCTLHNVDFFNNLALGEGDEIAVTKFNEIIPGIVSNNTRSGTYKLINKCPSCGSQLLLKNTGTANVLYCPNSNCPSRSLAKFVHFVSKNCMDIRGISEATLEAMISHGFIHTFRDIYHLTDYKKELILLDGLGKKSVDNLLKSIEDSRNVKLSNFIAALGIPNIGSSAAKTISEYCNGSLERLLALWGKGFDFTNLNDFGEIMAKGLDNYITQNYADIAILGQEMDFVVPEQNHDSSLAGLKFCITGSFSQPRDMLKSQLEARGAKFVGSVSKNIDVLFAGEKAGSKLTKAQSLGVRIETEDYLMQLLE